MGEGGFADVDVVAAIAAGEVGGDEAEVGGVADDHDGGVVGVFADLCEDVGGVGAAGEPADGAEFGAEMIGDDFCGLQGAADVAAEDEVGLDVVGFAKAGDALGLVDSFFRKDALIVV